MSQANFWLFVSYSRMKHSPRSRFHNFIRVLFAFLSPDNINKVQTVQTLPGLRDGIIRSAPPSNRRLASKLKSG